MGEANGRREREKDRETQWIRVILDIQEEERREKELGREGERERGD